MQLNSCYPYSASVYSSRKWDRSTPWNQGNLLSQGLCEGRAVLCAIVSPVSRKSRCPKCTPENPSPRPSENALGVRSARAGSTECPSFLGWHCRGQNSPQRSGKDPPQDSTSPQHFYKKIAWAPEPG